MGTGVVENIIVWGGDSDWSPPDDYIAVQSDTAQIGWTYSDGKFSSPPIPEKAHDELMLEAEAEKQYRLDYASSKITVWQTKLLMGRTLTASESAQLNTWMDYIDALEAIDTSTAPDIVWPEMPA